MPTQGVLVKEKPLFTQARWTHLALHVRSIEESVAFYTSFTSLRTIEQHSDADSTGPNMPWLGDHPAGTETWFVLVRTATTSSFPTGRRSVWAREVTQGGRRRGEGPLEKPDDREHGPSEW